MTSPTVPVPYTTLVRQFRAAPPGKLYCMHGDAGVFRLSLYMAAQGLLNGIPITLVDGTNRFDAYYIAEFARACAAQDHGRNVTPQQMLDNIFIARAFTCYQMEATITERLAPFVRSKGSPVVIIFGLLDTFYDEQAPLFEVKAGLQRVITALNDLKHQQVSLLLASRDITLEVPERNTLFPRLLSAMDEVFSVNGEGRRIISEGRGGMGRIVRHNPAQGGRTPTQPRKRTGMHGRQAPENHLRY